MGQTANELRSELDRKRAELTRDVDRLEDKVRSTFNIRQQVEEYPLQMTGLSLAAGFLLGNLVGGHHAERPQHDAPSQSRAGVGSGRGTAGANEPLLGAYSSEISREWPRQQHAESNFFSTLGESVKEGFRRSTGGSSFDATLSNLSAAMLAMLLDKAKDALDANLPGFAEKFDQIAGPDAMSSGQSTMTTPGERRPAMDTSPATTPYSSAAAGDRFGASYPSASSTVPNQ